jgi:AsmA-like C-terminal region
MAHATATRPVRFETRQQNGPPRWRKVALILAAVLVVLAAIAMALCQRPFTETAVLQDLREVSGSQVEVRAFHRTFPFPGCVLDGVIFRHGPSQAKPLITIERMTVRGSYLGVLSTRVERIIAEGMHVSIPAFGTGEAFHTTPSTITVGEIIANGATVEFAYHEPDKKPLRFDVHEATLRNVGPKGAISYRLKVHNPEPPGEVAVEGKFGAWSRGDAGKTPISGEYTFEQADLSVYKGIAGILSSKGKFSGTLGHIDISGTTDTPDFEVRMGRHPMRLTTQFSAYVDATHGDTFLKQVTADFWKTHVIAAGSIARSSNGKGKPALIDFRSNDARIEDLLRLFVKAERAPMSGYVTLRARAEVPPADEEFLKKLKLRGSFGIEAGTFSKPSTQEGVNKLSAGARGEKDPVDPETVLTDLTGQVDATEGIATFTDLSFSVPGAVARMHGTYNLLDHKIDLHGQMQVDSKISNTESGAKALLLKMMEPFFKKKKKGEIVPVRISGTYEHPSFGLDLNDKKAQTVAEPAKPSKSVPPSPHQ